MLISRIRAVLAIRVHTRGQHGVITITVQCMWTWSFVGNTSSCNHIIAGHNKKKKTTWGSHVKQETEKVISCSDNPSIIGDSVYCSCMQVGTATFPCFLVPTSCRNTSHVSLMQPTTLMLMHIILWWSIQDEALMISFHLVSTGGGTI